MFVSVSCQDAYFHKILSFLWVFFKSKIKQEEFEDTKGVIRIRLSKDRQHNGQKKKYKRTDNTMAKKKKYQRTNNDLQNITQKTKHRVTRTQLKTGGEQTIPDI